MGNVTGTIKVGGLVGDSSGSISSCYSTGDVTGTASNVGGLVGSSYGRISSCYSTGNVTGTGDYVGGLVGSSSGKSISSCYSTGNVTGTGRVGGLVGYSDNGSISSCYSMGNVTGTIKVGGLVGYSDNGSISSCYSTGSVSGQNWVGGLVGEIWCASGTCNIMDSLSYSEVSGTQKVGSFIGGVSNTSNDTTYGTVNISGCKSLSQDLPLISGCYNSGGTPNTVGLDDMLAGISEIGLQSSAINLQIGIDSSSNSQITFDTSIKNDLLGGLSGLDLTDASALSKIDAVIQDVTSKQTELGSVQNRLESVLDSISVQYENLVSARSTVRDADVAKESAAYIKSQILQQASATLLATANQSPALALTLIGGLQRRG